MMKKKEDSTELIRSVKADLYDAISAQRQAEILLDEKLNDFSKTKFGLCLEDKKDVEHFLGLANKFRQKAINSLYTNFVGKNSKTKVVDEK